MAPDSSISFRWLLTSSTISGGICLKRSLNGVSSVTLMVCSVEWVHPSSMLGPMKIHHDTRQGAGRPFTPIRGPMSPSHLNLTHQTVYLAFALSLTLELEGQHILPLELVDSLAWGSWLATVLVLPFATGIFF